MKKNRLNNGVTYLFCHSEVNFLSAKTRILFILLAFLLPLFVMASPLEEIRITIQQKNVPLSKVFKEIEAKTDYSFLIRNNDVDTNQKVSIEAKNKTVAEVLGMIFDGKGINYEVNGKRISVYKAIRQQTSGKRKVSGRIIDTMKEPVIGASVSVTGTTNGTITDLDGNFSLELPDGDASLQVSYIGYKSQTISVGNKSSVVIVLEEDQKVLDEVVVVGYGTQKKVNLTGSVAVVTAAELQERPVSNLSQALQGIVPGLQISQTSGSLEESPTINVRGTATIGEGSSGDPLVLIDGVEGDLNMVNPQDVANISVLKDAAASSIYGSRAPFGVILVTTKNGGSEGKVSINYNNSFRIGTPINMNNMMNSVDFASWINDHFANNGSTVFFDQERMSDIVAYRNAKPYKRGQRITENGTILHNIAPRSNGTWGDGYRTGVDDVDWIDAIFNDHTFAQEHSFSVNGGNKKFNYYASFNYLNQGGMVKLGDDGMNRYLGMMKINSEINDWLRFSYSMRFTRKDYHRPSNLSGNIYEVMTTQGWPTLPLYDPNGYYYSAPSPALGLVEGGSDRTQNDNTFHQIGFKIEPVKNWVTHIDFNYRINNYNRHWETQLLYNHDKDGNPVVFNKNSHVYEQNSQENYWNLNAYSEYTHTFNEKHNLHVLAGFQAEELDVKNFSVQRDGMMFPTKPLLDLTSGLDYDGNKTDPSIYGNQKDWATAGFFGRVNYDFKGRYLLEANVRADGTSRFRSGNRWRVFPSVSIGWNIAQEKFFEPLTDVINSLKLRSSFGTLGNQNTTNWYQTYQILSLGASNGSWPMGGSRPNTAIAPDLVSTELGWETIQNYNVGLDWGLLNNRLTGSFEYYIRNTKDMVGLAPEMPNILGTKVPVINNTDLRTQGWEFSIGWRDRLSNGLNYSVNFNLSDARTKITRYPNNPTNSVWSYMSGHYMGEIWGYTTKGLARTDQEMQDHLATLPNGGQSSLGSDWRAGDIMYADINEDGKISTGTETLGDSGDLSVIGNSTPRFLFGLDLNANWKGFDFRAFFQGVMKRDMWQGGAYMFGSGYSEWSSAGIVAADNYFRDENSWSVQNGYRKANVNAFLPRPLYNDKNRQCQTRYLQNAAYMRLKNLTVGYTLPATFTQKFGMQNLRVFFSGENLWTVSGVSKQFDPETLTGEDYGGIGYPLSTTLSFGISITL